jgi:hypothetical protein
MGIVAVMKALYAIVGSFEDGNGEIVMTNGRVSTIINEIVNSIASVNNWKLHWNPKKESISLTIRKESQNNIDKGIELYKNLNKIRVMNTISNESELINLFHEFQGKIRISLANF